MSINLLKANDINSKALPPPGTIPSAIAALVALDASSALSLISPISRSELAPTYTMATPPINLAKRSSCFNLSNGNTAQSI